MEKTDTAPVVSNLVSHDLKIADSQRRQTDFQFSCALQHQRKRRYLV